MRPPAEGCHVRPACTADLPGLASLGGPTPLAALDLCRAAGTLWVGVARDGRPVAYLAAGEIDSSLLILDLHVHPEHRRHGLGTALLGLALDRARWAFYPAASTVTEREAPGQGPFFAAHGFLRLRSDALPPGLKARLDAQGGDPGRLCAMAKRL